MVNLDAVRIGFAAGNHQRRQLPKRAGCTSGGFYTAPSVNSSPFNSSNPITFSWNPTCLSPPPSTVDIYLYAPSATKPLIHQFPGVDYSPGIYQATLQPSWWAFAPSVALQLNIVPHGTPTFLTTLPPGPFFNVTYDQSTNPSAKPGSGSTNISAPYQVEHNNYSGGGLSKGALAAAVIAPILVVAVALAIYIKITRSKEDEKRKRWSQAIDHRMSTMSTDWRSVSRASRDIAFRNSLASHRSSAFTASDHRSSVASSMGNPGMEQVRHAHTSTFTTSRASRISFAPDPRLSATGESLRPVRSHNSGVATISIPSRAFHMAQSPVDEPVTPVGLLSPTQALGPNLLRSEDIGAQIRKSVNMGVSTVTKSNTLQIPIKTSLPVPDTVASTPADVPALSVPQLRIEDEAISMIATFPAPPPLAHQGSHIHDSLNPPANFRN
ncbi:hypothetical protein BOTBODRAFT_178691 [Botryobasidium botryosum FD-172 SS1]|uniref:Uncharacterized protein n=1 Tax=Botryobasidium botryosum (strain FD-172 SS1) TaxID=930990 RepID=A0A067MDX1_BOTB1|nr:hypothetical protein BOTBODRAFT_178691 [Botryobasidium botryosum FD-172 SS1]